MTSPTPEITPHKPELLAPAGDWDCVRAAIENGADAIYFGMDCGFNARARAANFQLDDLPELMDLLRRRNVLGYVTLNTLAFPSELPEVEKLIRHVAECGVDAALVQDIGVARLAKEICSDLPLHASTQMTMTSAETIALAEELELQRVVVARELSLDEIRDIRAQTEMPIETFVHGALCVAYSGQCLTSEALGGRSANRGQCAQACRLPYELIADGELRDLGNQQYLLSPQDLAAYELTPELLEAGVCSLKIEGRLKSPEYVANITRHYRQAIDAANERQSVNMTTEQKYDMEMSFSRGFSPGWLNGCDHKMLVPAISSSKKGVIAGSISNVRNGSVEVKLECSMAPGDGIVFDGDRTSREEQGGRVFTINQNGSRVSNATVGQIVELSFARDAIDFSTLYAGQLFWKTDDPKLNQRLRKTFDVSDPVRRVPLELNVQCKTGEPLRARGRAANGATCEVETAQPLELARKHAISEQTLHEQFGRLGHTVFELARLDAEIEADPMVPFSVLGEVRREIVNQLEQAKLNPNYRISQGYVLPKLRDNIRHSITTSIDSNERKPASEEAVLHVLCRTLEQVHAVSEHSEHQIYADFQDIREYADAVACAHANGSTIRLATPRIQKPGEMGIFRSLERHGADGYLVRNYSGFQFFCATGATVVADFSLNIANELTAQYFIDSDAERVTASYDLNREQLLDLVAAAPPRWLEVVIHQHMPMFHMEHCVFCAVLSPGTNKTNCGRPCDTMQVELRDRVGMEHPLTADVGCRNTLWNKTPQSAAEIAPQLLSTGVRHFRIELLRESAADALRTVDLYQQLLEGNLQGHQVWRELSANNRIGVTRGAM